MNLVHCTFRRNVVESTCKWKEKWRRFYVLFGEANLNTIVATDRALHGPIPGPPLILMFINYLPMTMQPLSFFFVYDLKVAESSGREVLRMDIQSAINWEKRGICQPMQRKATCFKERGAFYSCPRRWSPHNRRSRRNNGPRNESCIDF